MSLRPFNDKLLISIPKGYGFGESGGTEKGIVVGVPDKMIYFGFHSFLADSSLGNDEVLNKILTFYQDLKGKTVFWESLQDSGRHFKEGDSEFVLLNMSDVIAYTDDNDADIHVVDQTGAAGSFNLS